LSDNRAINALPSESCQYPNATFCRSFSGCKTRTKNIRKSYIELQDKAISTPGRPKTGDILQAITQWLGEHSVAEQDKLAAEIGMRLAKLRKDKGITQAELAERLGISQPMASDYERGKLRLHGELIIQLSEILEVSADEILGIIPSKAVKKTVKNRRLSNRLEAIDKLPKRDQDALFRTIDAFISK
jgi:transcriptional regulator with XRE-family HTH domain